MLVSEMHHIHSSRTFTCIACHPSEEVVLTGDSTGRVVVWQNIFSREKSQSVFHWHTLPVRTVSFSTSGDGGGECVLVKWQFDNVNDKKFVPRIAAELEHVSVAKNNVYVAVATSDNTVRIFDSQLYQIALIQHLVLGKQYSSGIVYDPRTRALIMNGNQGQVQFYSPSDMSLLYSVDIVGQNKITNERDATIQNTEIMRVALSKNGHWLATVEERKDEKYQNEIRLKFWKFDNEKQIFELNTSIEYPHEHSVNSMLFQPANKSPELRCVTVANDKKFKIWQLDEVTRKKDVAWKCLASDSSGTSRVVPCLSPADGSLMATGFGQILTVWTPDTCHLKCSLIHPLYKEKVKHVQFGYSNQCHLLVSASANQLSVWNLLTLCMVWTVPVRVALLVADPLSTNVAVMTQQKEGSVVKCYIWYFENFCSMLTELYCVSGSENPTDATSELPEDGSSFSIMTPNHKTSLAQSATPRRHMYEKDAGHVTLKKYLDAPIHTMAPVRYTCYGLLKSLTVQKDSVS
ncbi:hypothetical protein NQ318_022189 [Aromia moschata]|uniref:WD repeat-containing protein 75 second beta-propeller domain-containing protein n=1 Tax=Aromia moschata TaxID=1265417 RepID=A0AAV8Z8D2_9CUCU|nr:hypothetical protein NQ318_022189 [Aromia moschata]